MEKAEFKDSIRDWKDKVVFAAFSNERNFLSGYAIVEEHDDYAAFSVLRVRPEDEKSAVNAAMCDGILKHYEAKLRKGYYICDGARSIRHETAFQDYLEKYFEFRKAYCRLNVQYRKGFGTIINLLYPFRKLIRGKTGIGSKISGILHMEEYRRGSY